MNTPGYKWGGVLRRHSRFLVKLLICLIVAFGIFTICFRGYDPDFGWHLKSGHHFFQAGIPEKDIYSYTMPDFAWVNHEWLNDVVSWVVYDYAGIWLLALMFAGLWFGGLIIAARKINWQLLMIGFVGLVPYLGIRPVAWSFLFIAILELLVDQYRTQQKSISLLSIVGLFGIWANIHAGFAFGLLVLWLHGIYRRDRQLLTTGLLSAVVTLINPYGWRIYEEIARTMFDSELKNRITEWHHLFSDPSTGLRTLAPAIFLIFALLFLAVRFTKKPIKQVGSIPLLTLLMAFQTNRHMVLFIVTSIRYIGEGLDIFKAGLVKRWRIVIALLFIIPFTYTYLRMVVPKILKQEDDFTSLSRIVSQNCMSNVFNYYDVGGALIKNSPNIKIYIDGRMPSWTNNEGNIFDRYLKVIRSSNYRRLEFNRFNISCVVLPDRGDAVSLMARDLYAENWKLVGVSGGYVLIKK